MIDRGSCSSVKVIVAVAPAIMPFRGRQHSAEAFTIGTRNKDAKDAIEEQAQGQLTINSWQRHHGQQQSTMASHL